MNARTVIAISTLALTIAAGCTPERDRPPDPVAVRVDGTPTAVLDTIVDAVFDAAGVAQPFQEATLSTKLMGTVTAVLALEGDAVTLGQPLVRIDAVDLAAKETQAAASVTQAEASHREATAYATRIRALYADSAATKSQLDAAEAGLARAEAGARVARGAADELAAIRGYAVVRAPFAGVVARRLVDVGAFAAPGTPLVTVQDIARLRIEANASPDVVARVRRGMTIPATIEGQPVTAVVEGVVPAVSGNMATVNAIVANPGRTMLAGSAATLALPLGSRRALVIPAAAVRREGDLTGATVRTADNDALRWIRVGREHDGLVEVLSGLRAGDQIVVPSTPRPATLGVRN